MKTGKKLFEVIQGKRFLRFTVVKKVIAFEKQDVLG